MISFKPHVSAWYYGSMYSPTKGDADLDLKTYYDGRQITSTTYDMDPKFDEEADLRLGQSIPVGVYGGDLTQRRAGFSSGTLQRWTLKLADLIRETKNAGIDELSPGQDVFVKLGWIGPAAPVAHFSNHEDELDGDFSRWVALGAHGVGVPYTLNLSYGVSPNPLRPHWQFLDPDMDLMPVPYCGRKRVP